MPEAFCDEPLSVYRNKLAIAFFIIHYPDWKAGNNFGSFADTATIRSLVCSREMRPQAFLDRLKD
jgi:hypothetical protein